MVDVVLVLALIASLATVYLYNRKPKQSHPLPPGPPQAFILGNARDVPAAHKEIKFAEWGKKYGTYLRLLARTIDPKTFMISFCVTYHFRTRRVPQRLRSPHHRSKHR